MGLKETEKEISEFEAVVRPIVRERTTQIAKLMRAPLMAYGAEDKLKELIILKKLNERGGRLCLRWDEAEVKKWLHYYPTNEETAFPKKILDLSGFHSNVLVDAMNFRTPEWKKFLEQAAGVNNFYEFPNASTLLSHDAFLVYGISLFWGKDRYHYPKQIAVFTGVDTTKVGSEDCWSEEKFKPSYIYVGGVCFGEKYLQPIYFCTLTVGLRFDLPSDLKTQNFQKTLDLTLLKAYENAPYSHESPFDDEARRLRDSFIPPPFLPFGPSGPSEYDILLRMPHGDGQY